MAGPVGLPVIDTMIGFPHEGGAVRLHPQADEGPRSKEDFEFPVEYMFKDVPKGLPTDDPVALMLQRDGPVRHREGDDRRRRRLRRSWRSSATPTASSRPARSSDPNEGMDAVPRIATRVRAVRHPRDVGVPGRYLPAGADQRQEDVPDLREVRRARHPDLRLRRRARAAGSVRAAGGRAHRRGDVRLPRAGVRHAPRLRAVGGPRGQADAEVAEPVLLDVGVRAEALPEGHHRLREHARRRQDHLRRLLPDGAVTRPHLRRDAERAVQRPRVAEVPVRQRRPHPRVGRADDL